MGLLDFLGKAKATGPEDEGAALERARDLAHAELSAADAAVATAVAAEAAAREDAKRSDSATPTYSRAKIAREDAADRVEEAKAAVADADARLAAFIAEQDALAQAKERREHLETLRRKASWERFLADTAGAREDMVHNLRGLFAATATVMTEANTANEAGAELRANGEAAEPFARHVVLLPLLEFLASEDFDTAESIANALESHRITELVPQRNDGSIDVERVAAIFGFEFRKRPATPHTVQRAWRWFRARNNREALATMNAAEANAAE